MVVGVADEDHIHRVGCQGRAVLGTQNCRDVFPFFPGSLCLNVLEKPGRYINSVHPAPVSHLQGKKLGEQSGTRSNISDHVSRLDFAGLQNPLSGRINLPAFNFKTLHVAVDVKFRVEERLVDPRLDALFFDG